MDQNVKRFNNLSNGIDDGVVLFYLKDGKLHPILLNADQAEMLDLVITTPFVDSKMLISEEVLKVEVIRHMLAK